jgi:hypothetical protein
VPVLTEKKFLVNNGDFDCPPCRQQAETGSRRREADMNVASVRKLA